MTAQLSRSTVALRRTRTTEWPTLALWVLITGGFAGITLFHDRLPATVVGAVGAVLIAWYGSLQHELIHGHPTPSRKMNRALGAVPLNLWLPFESYRMSHLIHHCDDALTDPLDDPESYYWSAAEWDALGPIGRAVVRAHTTLAGRLAIGPAWNIGRYLCSEFRAVRNGDRLRRRIWAWHALGAAAVLLWVVGVCHMSVMFYVLGIVYPGTALLLLRSFAEHRAEAGVFERTAIVENSWLFGPVFLFNNLHAAHHERPLMPWYELPAWYKINRTRLHEANGGLVYNSYVEVVRRFLFKPHHVIVHPLATGERAAADCLPAPASPARPESLSASQPA